jgi:hypothetical protein
MRKFILPFSYTVNGEIEIEAVSLQRAINEFNKLAEYHSTTGHFPILDRATKLVPNAETLEVDEDVAADINPPTKYTVHIVRTQTVDVQVEAHDENEAEEIASRMVHVGEMEDYFRDETIEVEEVEETEE